MPKKKSRTMSPISPETLRGIREFRLIDDVYFTVFYDDFREGMELTLRIILQKPDIVVKQVVTQRTAGNLYGRGVRFDVLAEDVDGKLYNCEVQRLSKGANPRRARYNSAMLDVRAVEKGARFEDLPETYVIFITERDVFGKGWPVYKFDRTLEGTAEKFNDGAHILYVNGECRDDTDLGKLMQDYFCTDPAAMHYGPLAERAHFLKDKPEGVSEMNEILENIMKRREADAAAKAAEEATVKAQKKTQEENALNFLAMGLSPEDVAKGTKLPLEEVKKLAERRTA